MLFISLPFLLCPNLFNVFAWKVFKFCFMTEFQQFAYKKSGMCPTAFISERFSFRLAKFLAQHSYHEARYTEKTRMLQVYRRLHSINHASEGWFLELEVFGDFCGTVQIHHYSVPRIRSTGTLSNTSMFLGLDVTAHYWLQLKRCELLCVITQLSYWNCLKDKLYIAFMAFITFSSD